MRIPGVAHRSELGQLGITEADRRRLLRQGRMARVGTWYVTSAAPAGLLPLLRRGIRPTCLTAATYHRLWVPVHTDHHVYRPRGMEPGAEAAVLTEPGAEAAILTEPGAEAADLVEPEADGPKLVAHGSGLRSWPDTDPVADLPLALDHAARCLPVRDAAILFESALHRRQLTLTGARRIIAGLPRSLADQLRRVSPLAESGTETAVRWWLESLRVPVAPQVWIAGVGRVDLKVGASWIIECDSVTFHDDPKQYHRDRARDLQLVARRYQVTRLTWEQVFLNWDETRLRLLAVLRRRDHRRPLP